MAKTILLGVAATLIGLLAAGVIVGAVEAVSALLYPDLAETIRAKQEAGSLKADDIPAPAVAIVLVAWCVGAVAGSFVAALLTAKLLRRRSLLPAYAFGLLFVAACVVNLWLLPHPVWMEFLGIAAPALLVMTTTKLTLRAFYRSSERNVT